MTETETEIGTGIRHGEPGTLEWTLRRVAGRLASPAFSPRPIVPALSPLAPLAASLSLISAGAASTFRLAGTSRPGLPPAPPNQRAQRHRRGLHGGDLPRLGRMLLRDVRSLQQASPRALRKIPPLWGPALRVSPAALHESRLPEEGGKARRLFLQDQRALPRLCTAPRAPVGRENGGGSAAASGSLFGRPQPTASSSSPSRAGSGSSFSSSARSTAISAVRRTLRLVTTCASRLPEASPSSRRLYQPWSPHRSPSATCS